MTCDQINLLVFAEESELSAHIQAFLQQTTYQVHIEENIATLLALCAEGKVDAVLFYFHKDIPSHPTLLDQLGQQFSTIPVITATHAHTAKEVTELLRRRAKAVFRLPLFDEDLEALSECIERHVMHEHTFIENAKMREELELDQRAGRIVQESLLPPIQANFNGLTIERYMQSSLYLSGDTVDYVELDNGQLLFYLGDVSGHGTSSGLLTVLVKIMMQNNRGLYQDFGAGKSDLIHLINNLNIDVVNLNINKHLTMFVGMISADRKMLNYVVCGHYPMPIIQQNGQTQLLEGLGNGFPLGLMDDVDYTANSISLASDFKLLVCSDGVFEIMACDPEVDQESMLITMIENHGCHINGIKSGLKMQENQHIPDDIAVLSIMGGDNV